MSYVHTVPAAPLILVPVDCTPSSIALTSGSVGCPPSTIRPRCERAGLRPLSRGHVPFAQPRHRYGRSHPGPCMRFRAAGVVRHPRPHSLRRDPFARAGVGDGRRWRPTASRARARQRHDTRRSHPPGRRCNAPPLSGPRRCRRLRAVTVETTGIHSCPCEGHTHVELTVGGGPRGWGWGGSLNLMAGGPAGQPPAAL